MAGKPTVYPTGKLESAVEEIVWYAEGHARDRWGLTEEEAEFVVAWLILPDKWRGDEYEDSQIPIMESLKDKGFVDSEH